MKPSERERFLAKSIVTSVNKERVAGKSLALLRPEISEFVVTKKSSQDIIVEQTRFEAIRAQADFFAKEVVPYHPCPYQFQYRYRSDDGERFGTCQDWEIEATFFHWSRLYGEKKAILEMQRVFGDEMPRKGLLLAMGTHSQYPDTWLINGVVRLDGVTQQSLI